MGAWTAWLNLLDRLRKADEARREQARNDPDAWRRGGKEYNEDMKGWKGQALSEYLAIIGGVVCAILVIVAFVYINFFAPCDTLGWVSLQSLPVRCITGVIPR